MDPQQKIFTYLLTALRSKGYDVYDGDLPAAGVPYPFIYLGEAQQVDRRAKKGIMGTVYQTIHVYHDNVRQHGKVSALLADVKATCYGLEARSNWLVSECSDQILPDNTTNKPLIHGIVDVGFMF